MHLRRTAILCCLPLLLLIVSGCTLFGVLAGKVAPEPLIPPSYTGLLNQTVAIMVWAGDGTLIDFPDVRLDLAGGLQTKLQQAEQPAEKVLGGITFPVSPAAVVRFQDNHPENDTKSLAEVAPKLNVTRVIYIEIENLQTRSNAAVELYRGSATATMKIIEVPEDGGPGKIAFEESGIEAIYPPKAREEGTPNGNDFTIYRGTVDALTSEIAKRFVPHTENQ
jgi:hypothetical protein